MSANDLIILGKNMMLWFVAIIMFVTMLAILFAGFILAVEVGLIAWKEVKKNGIGSSPEQLD